jgi:monofunctional biosynthetic peptidoglycan transglycosylase
MRSLPRGVAIVFLVVLVFNAAVILLLRWVPPPTTMFMLMAPVRPVHYHWVSQKDISPEAALAAIAGEDLRFPNHCGFDFKAIYAAVRYNEHSHNLHGASTITQQTAKNLFLWRGRDYVRKALEAYFTVQLEALWGKRRIMEVYLNIAQFGPDVYGVEAAAERYFGKHAAQLSGREAALLVAVLPCPDRLRVDHPSSYVNERVGEIEAQMRKLGRRDLSRVQWAARRSRPPSILPSYAAIARL